MTSQQSIERQAILSIAYNSFQKKLNSHAYFKVSDYAIAEDLVQDTFLKTWGYLVKGGKVELMQAFLYHVLNAKIIDHYRKKNKASSLDTLAEKGFDPSDDQHERLLNLLDGKSAVRLILRLPLKFQAIMKMRYVEDLSPEQMSFRNGKSKNTNAVHLHRGLEKLKLLYNLRLAGGTI